MHCLLARALVLSVATLAVSAVAAPPASQPATGPAAPMLTPAPKAAGSEAAAESAPVSTHEMTHSDLESFMDGFMPYALQTGDIAGGVVAVVRDGEIVFAKGYGYADVAARKPVDPKSTMFRPGSVSKLFTWTSSCLRARTDRSRCATS
jgi:CubicO group peptidase (beta-lactamase class C family)